MRSPTRHRKKMKKTVMKLGGGGGEAKNKVQTKVKGPPSLPCKTRERRGEMKGGEVLHDSNVVKGRSQRQQEIIREIGRSSPEGRRGAEGWGSRRDLPANKVRGVKNWM